MLLWSMEQRFAECYARSVRFSERCVSLNCRHQESNLRAQNVKNTAKEHLSLLAFESAIEPREITSRRPSPDRDRTASKPESFVSRADVPISSLPRSSVGPRDTYSRGFAEGIERNERFRRFRRSAHRGDVYAAFNRNDEVEIYNDATDHRGGSTDTDSGTYAVRFERARIPRPPHHARDDFPTLPPLAVLPTTLPLSISTRGRRQCPRRCSRV